MVIRRKCLNSRAQSSSAAAIKSTQTKSKSLNVTDDITDSSTTSSTTSHRIINKLTKFARLLVCEEQSGPPKNSNQRETLPSIDETLKVNQYLDGLESVVVSYHGVKQPSSSSSESSVNNLIIPVNPLQVPQPASQKQPLTSVCTLSTTSSSCISDEGCYGSSDFSSERDGHLRQLMQQQFKSAKIYSNTTPKICQQNYYINNLSRFEKIYNDELVDKPNRVSPYLVKSFSARNDEDSAVSSSPTNSAGFVVGVNVVSAALSGSYV